MPRGAIGGLLVPLGAEYPRNDLAFPRCAGGGRLVMTAASAPRGHVQVPRSLLYSCDHSAMAAWAWATYETLMPHRLGGGRAPAFAGRQFVACQAGVSTTALDDARRELLAPTSGGPFLSRSAPRGAKRSVEHMALRLPRKTGEGFAPVPSWTLDLVWAGRRRQEGRISPEAWRLYAACVDRACRKGRPQTFEATVARLGSKLQASQATRRRRLAELERAGLVEVTEQSGGWPSIRVILDADEAADAAENYAREGRRRVEPRQDPSHIAALTPRKNRQEPLAGSGTPQESPSKKTPVEEAPALPAVGEHTRSRTQTRVTAEAGNSRTRRKGRPTPRRPRRQVLRAAAEVYRTLPAELTRRIPEHGSRRVLSAISAELEHRTPAELAERIAGNWEHWRYRLTAAEPIRDPVALTIRLTRRGLDCPDVRCEDGYQLDVDAPCKACTMAKAEHAAEHAAGPDQACAEEPPELQLDHGVDFRRTSTVGISNESTRYARSAVDTAAATAAMAKAVDGRRYAALARALLKSRTAAEREEILARHSDARTA
jgi:DNA-binding transcriptional ArsR family regulator